MSKFTKKHYEFVADIIASLKMNIDDKREIAYAFSRAFEPDNERFEPGRFIDRSTKIRSVPE